MTLTFGEDARRFASVSAISLILDDSVDAAVHVGVIGKAGGSAVSSAALAAFDRAADSVTHRVGAVNSR